MLSGKTDIAPDHIDESATIAAPQNFSAVTVDHHSSSTPVANAEFSYEGTTAFLKSGIRPNRASMNWTPSVIIRVFDFTIIELADFASRSPKEIDSKDAEIRQLPAPV